MNELCSKGGLDLNFLGLSKHGKEAVPQFSTGLCGARVRVSVPLSSSQDCQLRMLTCQINYLLHVNLFLVNVLRATCKYMTCNGFMCKQITSKYFTVNK